jgi:subtilase family serine protease
MLPLALGAIALLLAAPQGSLAVGPEPLTEATARPMSTAGGASTAVSSPTCSPSALCPSMMANAYDLNPLLSNKTTNGTGQTVVIIVACGDATIKSDLAAFDAQFGLPSAPLSTYQPGGTPCSDPTGWGLETAMDVEWAHVVAPGAALAVVEAKSQLVTSMLAAWNFSLTHHLGQVMSNSWGTLGKCPFAAKQLLLTAVASRVTVVAASGDNGPGRPWLMTEPADCTKALTVGGTTLAVNATGSYLNETPWTGSGGGFSLYSSEPAYQQRANISDPYAALGKPDVSAVGDPKTGVWVYDNSSGGWNVEAGTSLGAPLWAGFLTDINSWRAALLQSPVGFVNPFLYGKVFGPNGASPSYRATMHDVTVRFGSGLRGVGWDVSTGLGSFDAASLARYLATHPAA